MKPAENQNSDPSKDDDSGEDVKEAIETKPIDLNKLWEEVFTTRDTHEMKKKAVNFLTFGLTTWDVGSDLHLFLNYLTGTDYTKMVNCGTIKGTIRKMLIFVTKMLLLSYKAGLFEGTRILEPHPTEKVSLTHPTPQPQPQTQP